jgi:hypothetical protein
VNESQVAPPFATCERVTDRIGQFRKDDQRSGSLP